MTIGDEARPIFDTIGFTREGLLLAAKSVAQEIIDRTREPALCGLVYDVRGLYNDGQPKCRWTAPYDDDEIVFTGQFRVEDGAEEEAFVVRRVSLSPSALEDRIRALHTSGVRG
jgi:hypothetical protein